MHIPKPEILRKWARYCFYLMWIPFGTFMAGMADMPEGAYTFGELPVLAQYSVIPMGTLFASTFLLYAGSMLASSLQKRTLLKKGRPAVAKILNVYETGSTVNNSPLVGFELKVTPPDSFPFTATTEQLVSRLAVPLFQPGAEINVKYDPNTKRVAILSLTNDEGGTD